MVESKGQFAEVSLCRMPLNLGRRRFLGAIRPPFAGLRSVKPLRDVLILAAVYFAAAKLGLRLALYHPSATPVWPPTGIALASMLLLGYRAGPGIFLGAFLANLTTYGTVWTSLSIATGNTLEGLVGTYLVNKYANSSNVFDHPRDIFKFAFLAAILSTAVSATIGVTSLALGGFAPWADYRLIWLTWWLGDATGALIFAPLLILYAKDPHRRWSGQAMLERALFLVALLSISWIVFGDQFPFVYLTVPFLVWAALRFDQRETAGVVVLLTLIAVWATIRHLGPLVGATPNESLLLLQAFMGIAALVALPLASVMAERRSADQKTTDLHLQLRGQNALLELRVRERTRELEDAYFEMVEGLAADEVELIRRAAPLHDVGKIGIPDRILLKPGTLVPEEFELMKTHVKVGAGILSEARSDLLRLAEEIALTHHERWDGTGYPRGLKGEAIPLSGRIVAVADVFDAIISTRPYRKARSIEEAIDVIENGAGTQFDPKIVDALMAHLDQAPSGHFADAGRI
ncbi:MAG: HD domain-containing protein [Methanobacteriota archaeon]|nr:MAG: HD domain-containing protein [Euryarchaeota archaeon]